MEIADKKQLQQIAFLAMDHVFKTRAIVDLEYELEEIIKKYHETIQ